MCSSDLLVGLVLIGVGGVAAQLLRNPAALIGTLVSLVLGGFLLVLSTTSLRGLTPGPGQPPARPELLSFAGGLVFVAIALALIVKGPRQAENRG